MEAPSYACSTCGGSVAEHARQCPFCDAHVATVRCGRCYHMNVPEALHCSGCGTELGLEPIAIEGELVCPDCAQPLAAFSSETGLLHDCAKCGGQFVDHPLLRELFERRQVFGNKVRRPPPAPPIAAARVRYVRCPRCTGVMNRKNFGGSSGVIVDVCRKDGIWFDEGELPRVLAFVESGGLALARFREAGERERARRDAIKSAAEMSAGTLSGGGYGLQGSDVAAAAQGIYELILSLTLE